MTKKLKNKEKIVDIALETLFLYTKTNGVVFYADSNFYQQKT